MTCLIDEFIVISRRLVKALVESCMPVLLPLNEAVASRAEFVNVSESDGRAEMLFGAC